MTDDVIEARDDGAWLPVFFRVTRDSVRAACQFEKNEGRIPRAFITWGFLTGHGWKFLPPWCQKAIGRHDDPRRVGEKAPAGEHHAPFIIIRLWSRIETRNHFLPQSRHARIRCRFYRALVWRYDRRWRWTWVD